MKEDRVAKNRADVKGYVLRRSPRAMVKIPVVIAGVNKDGYEFEEVTETFVVSKYGARVYTVHELEPEAILKLRLKDEETWVEFRVAWIGNSENGTERHIGIEFLQSTNFFGVVFPHEDWS